MKRNLDIADVDSEREINEFLGNGQIIDPIQFNPHSENSKNSSRRGSRKSSWFDVSDLADWWRIDVIPSEMMTQTKEVSRITTVPSCVRLFIKPTIIENRERLVGSLNLGVGWRRTKNNLLEHIEWDESVPGIKDKIFVVETVVAVVFTVRCTFAMNACYVGTVRLNLQFGRIFYDHNTTAKVGKIVESCGKWGVTIRSRRLVWKNVQPLFILFLEGKGVAEKQW